MTEGLHDRRGGGGGGSSDGVGGSGGIGSSGSVGGSGGGGGLRPNTSEWTLTTVASHKGRFPLLFFKICKNDADERLDTQSPSSVTTPRTGHKSSVMEVSLALSSAITTLESWNVNYECHITLVPVIIISPNKVQNMYVL